MSKIILIYYCKNQFLTFIFTKSNINTLNIHEMNRTVFAVVLLAAAVMAGAHYREGGPWWQCWGIFLFVVAIALWIAHMAEDINNNPFIRPIRKFENHVQKDNSVYATLVISLSMDKETETTKVSYVDVQGTYGVGDLYRLRDTVDDEIINYKRNRISK